MQQNRSRVKLGHYPKDSGRTDVREHIPLREHLESRTGQTRRILSLAASPFWEERQRFHRELLTRPKFCRSSAPQLRLRFIRRGY